MVGNKLFTRKTERVEFVRSSKDMWYSLIQIVRINKNIKYGLQRMQNKQGWKEDDF